MAGGESDGAGAGLEAFRPGGDPRVRREFDRFLSERRVDGPLNAEQREAIFQDFLRWQSQRQR
jgi:hypothetical protein